jgi:hypothetical protein
MVCSVRGLVSNYEEIAACAAEYSSARERLAANTDTDALADYEAVLRTRVALAECLLRAGWTPPQETQHFLMLDRRLLAEPIGGFEASRAQA